MKKTFLTLACLAFALVSKADTYEYLTFSTSNGNASMKAEGLVIKFANGNMIVKNSSEEKTFVLSTVNEFSFTSTDGVEVHAIEDESPVAVYSMSGQFVGRFAGKTEAVGQLHEGVYIIKGESGTQKVVVK